MYASSSSIKRKKNKFCNPGSLKNRFSNTYTGVLVSFSSYCSFFLFLFFSSYFSLSSSFRFFLLPVIRIEYCQIDTFLFPSQLSFFSCFFPFPILSSSLYLFISRSDNRGTMFLTQFDHFCDHFSNRATHRSCHVTCVFCLLFIRQKRGPSSFPTARSPITLSEQFLSPLIF